MQLYPMITDHMIIQAEKPIRIMGSGKGTVTAAIDNNKPVSLTSNDENWVITLPAMPYGGPHSLNITLDGEKRTISDVYIGDVYIVAGQSNMQIKMFESNTAQSEYEDNDLVRLYSPDRFEDTDYFHPCDGWVISKKDNLKNWSAIAYLTGKALNRKKGTAVGIIVCYQGASAIGSWIPKGLLESKGLDLPIEKKHWDYVHPTYSVWNKDGLLYDFMIKNQLIPYSNAGVLWYQGESDTTEESGKLYTQWLSVMVDCWRKAFQDNELPFFVVEIADFDGRNDDGWKSIQIAQHNAPSSISNLYAVKSSDICESNDIHPATKITLSNRLADTIIKAGK